MEITLLFWLALLLPGYVVVRRFAPEELESGLMGTLGLSYLAVFCLLAPFSIACYVLRLPVVFLSSVTVALILASLAYISRERWWRGIGRLVAAGVSVELVFLLVDLILGGSAGGYLEGGDARTHITRIRFLLDHGFSNLDPFYAEPYFFPIYHTNLFHSVFAVCAQVTGVDVLGVWYMSLVPAKLLIAAGSFYLGWCLFEKAWVAWTGALFVAAWLAPTTYVIYPNILAPHWLLPIMIGYGVKACLPRAHPSLIVKLAAGSFVLGQLHGLYAVVAGIGLGPVLAVVLVYRLLRRRANALLLAGCFAALFAGAPLVLVAQAGRVMDPTMRDPRLEDTEKFIRWDNGWAMRDPRQMMGGKGVLGLSLLAAGVGWAAMGTRRRETGVLIGVAVTGVVLLFVPPVCAVAIEALRAEWIVARMGILLHLGMVGLGVGAAANLLAPRLRWWWLRGLLSAGVILLGVRFSSEQAPYDWGSYLRAARSPSTQNRFWIEKLRGFSEFCREHISPGSTVLADVQTQLWLCTLHDAFGTGVDRGGGIPDLKERKRDTILLLRPDTPWPARRDLLERYEITQFLCPTQLYHRPEDLDWLRGHLAFDPQPFDKYVLFTLVTP